MSALETPGGRPAPPGRRAAAALLVLAALAAGAAVAVDGRLVYLAVYGAFGLAYGAVLQYGRFCMASAVRDLFAVGVVRMAVGVLIAVVLFALTAALVRGAGLSAFHASALGWHVPIGGAIFGLAMVFTGGCASSSLYKCGEGSLSALLVIVAISLSQAWFVSAGGWLDALVPASWAAEAAVQAQTMPAELDIGRGWFDQFLAGHVWGLQGGTLAERLGVEGRWLPVLLDTTLVAVLPALALLLLLYRLRFCRPWLKRSGVSAPGLADDLRGLAAMLGSSRNTAIAGLLLGLLAGLQMAVTSALREHWGILNFGEALAAAGFSSGLSLQDTVFDPGYWYITTQEAQLGGWIFERLGRPSMDNLFFGLDNGLPPPWLNAPLWMSAGIVVGAAVRANLVGEFKWKWPGLETALLALAGGALMGIGSRIGMGCNIGAFFATVTNGDPSGWLFLAGMSAGAFVGVRLLQRWIEWQASRQSGWSV
ncbi:YeeE/YedE thiosulfate transporter family protein [Rubrivivax gelatinosus]|uniref:YeeE/YedE thiosulfate transporter family protein n=1 Tax=Rubrivivax gelatinosus TaxID=28068 RepID=UPI001903DE11